jgi:hypothetical protein
MKTLFITGLLAAISYGPISAQTTEVLSGDLSGVKELDPEVCYELDGCYRVLSGGDLIIPAGTQIRANSQASLIVYQGGQIFANGTAANPVVFTSAQAVSSRAPGDWDGIYIAGYAATNQTNPSINKFCPGTILYGGSNDTDNSGTLQHVRIEYAGLPPVGDQQTAALNLLGVGTGTTIDHVQISYSRKDGYEVRGGKSDLNYMEALNNYRTDIQISEGYTGNIQFLTSVRLDANAHDNTAFFSNGIYIFNDATGSSTTPITHPVISNATFFGPGYCGASPHSDFRAAIRLALNTEADIYNGVFTGWNTGLEIVGANTIDNANLNGTIKMEYNTFYANGINFSNTPAVFNPSTSGCANTISDWMVSGACQLDNIERTSLTGYSSTICGDYCSTAPVMTLSAINDVGVADYTWDTNTDFTHEMYRGSLTNANWSSTWSRWCPQQEEYCELVLMKNSAPQGLQFVPNPASSQTAVTFETDITGRLTIHVMDKVSGKTLCTNSFDIKTPGKQSLRITTSSLREGVYPVQLRLSNGDVIAGQLMIK